MPFCSISPKKAASSWGPAQARGELLSWLTFVASGLGPYSGQSVHFRRAAPEQIPYAQNRYLREAERHYRVLDERPAGRNYIVGGEYTIVDIAAWAALIGRVSYWGMNGVTSSPPRARALSIIQRHLNLF
jgi:GSH-dependent disulfide-bond oxidoreductase